MEVLDKHIGLRRDMHSFYTDIFKNQDGVQVFTEHSDDFFSNHWLSCITVDEAKAGFSADTIREQLATDNIESRPLWKPMHLQPVFSSAPYYGSDISETLFKTGICLPSGSNLTSDERQRISKLLLQFA